MNGVAETFGSNLNEGHAPAGQHLNLQREMRFCRMWNIKTDRLLHVEIRIVSQYRRLRLIAVAF